MEYCLLIDGIESIFSVDYNAKKIFRSKQRKLVNWKKTLTFTFAGFLTAITKALFLEARLGTMSLPKFEISQDFLIS